METLTPHTPGQSNVTGNSVNIEDTNMSDSNQNGTYIHNVINKHVHFCVKCCSEYIFHQNENEKKIYSIIFFRKY